MKNYLLCFLILFLMSTSMNFALSEPNLMSTVERDSMEFIRTTFYNAIEDENELDRLEEFIKLKYSADEIQYSALLLAYIGGIEALRSKHAFWPFNKYSHFLKSMDLLDDAVKKSPNNLEIRFMRFSILHHVPGILGYGEERDDDMNTIFELLLEQDFSEIGLSIQKGFAEFLIDSERLDDLQMQLLKSNFILALNK